MKDPDVLRDPSKIHKEQGQDLGRKRGSSRVYIKLKDKLSHKMFYIHTYSYTNDFYLFR